jgi:hypothetical protein
MADRHVVKNVAYVAMTTDAITGPTFHWGTYLALQNVGWTQG